MGLNEQLQDVRRDIEGHSDTLERMETIVDTLIDTVADLQERIVRLEDIILEETKDAKSSDLGGSDG